MICNLIWENVLIYLKDFFDIYNLQVMVGISMIFNFKEYIYVGGKG